MLRMSYKAISYKSLIAYWQGPDGIPRYKLSISQIDLPVSR